MQGECTLAVRPMGYVRSTFAEPRGTPIQPVYGLGVRAQVVVLEYLAEALSDIDGFERIWLLYWLHRAGPFSPLVVPYRDTAQRGLFATRSPSRFNPLGLSAVRLTGRRGCVLDIEDVDLVDGTPILDIKPYVPEFDSYPGSRAGWLDAPGVDCRRADGRFHGSPPLDWECSCDGASCEPGPGGCLVLRLTGGVCIETASRRLLRMLVDRLLAAPAAAATAADPCTESSAVEILEAFLRCTDFAALRSSDTALAGLGGAECSFQVHIDPSGSGAARLTRVASAPSRREPPRS